MFTPKGSPDVARFAVALLGASMTPFALNADTTRAAANSRLESGARVDAAARVLMVGYTLAQVGPGPGVLTTALVVPEGVDARTFLIRAAGPALTDFGVNTPLTHPAIAIFNGSGEKVAGNDRWSVQAADVRTASSVAGTFPMAADSNDAALVIPLPAGQYTVQVSSQAGDTGAVLLEVYDLSGSTQRETVADSKDVHPAAALKVNRAPPHAAAEQLLVHLPLTANPADAAGNGASIRAEAIQFRDGAAWFDGQRSEIVLPPVAFDRRPFSLAMWVKLDDGFPSIGLVQQRAANRRNQHLHLVLRFGAPRLGFYVNDLQTTHSVAPASGWTHLVFQYNGREQEVWVNGQRVGVRAARPYVGKAGELQIGRAPRWTNVPAHDFKGGMRDLRIYSRALAPVEIRDLAKS